jgi:hypothetical protein
MNPRHTQPPDWPDRQCPNCRQVYRPTLLKDIETNGVTQGRYEAWRYGEHAQWTWPDAAEMDREQLLSGLCSDKCWDEYIGANACKECGAPTLEESRLCSETCAHRFEETLYDIAPAPITLTEEVE